MPSSSAYEARLNSAIDKLQYELDLARTISVNEVILIAIALILWCFIVGCLVSACCVLPCYRKWLRIYDPPDTPLDIDTPPPPPEGERSQSDEE